MNDARESFLARCSTSLLLSLSANVLLVALVVFMFGLLWQSQNGPADLVETPGPPPAPSPASSRPAEAPKPFHWRQLESADYQIYIANLRGIGCPDQTVRDIITADVAALYAGKRREFHLREDTQGRWSHEEEVAVVLALLGPLPVEPGTGETSANDPIMPLALQNIDANVLGLTETQQNIITNLRRKFSSEVGGPNQDPNDPQYAERWTRAQPVIDERLRVMLGNEAYRQLQRAARMNQVAH
jgi:hypothetical protein